IADAAGNRDIVRRRTLGQVGQTRPMPRQGRAIIAKPDFHFMITGNGPHAGRNRALEGLGINRAFRICA
ncbi:hypothetical protein O9566_18570, partial [Proteus mirabilis]